MTMHLNPAACCCAGFLFLTIRAQAAPPTACDYMNAQTASQTFGAALATGQVEIQARGTQCNFLRTGTQYSLMFSITDAKSMADALHGNTTDVIRLIREQQTGRPSETIPSLGEWNTYFHESDSTWTLTVLFHGKVLYLVTDGATNPNLKAAMVHAMRQSMQKL